MIGMATTFAGKLSEHIAPLFFLTVATGGGLRIDTEKILNAVVTAVVIGAVLGWFVKPQLDAIRMDIEQVKAMQTKMFTDIYAPSIPAKGDGK